MDKNSNQYESIKQKLQKLQALAERGMAGEAANAKRLIEKLCKKYGVTLEEVLSQDQPQNYEFEIGRYKYMLKLFMQCYAVVTNKGTLSYVQCSRSVIRVELTPLQYAELKNFFEWHKANFAKDVEAMQNTIIDAYLHKHNIFRKRSEEEEQNDNEELTPTELQKLRTMLTMMDELRDSHYHKMIE